MAHPAQYDHRGTRSSWRHWKRRLKRLTARRARRLTQDPHQDCPAHRTHGWAS